MFSGFVMRSFLSFRRIIQIRIEKAKVNKAKNFSKLVLAKIFPMVFNPNTTRKIHKVIFPQSINDRELFLYFLSSKRQFSLLFPSLNTRLTVPHMRTRRSFASRIFDHIIFGCMLSRVDGGIIPFRMKLDPAPVSNTTGIRVRVCDERLTGA